MRKNQLTEPQVQTLKIHYENILRFLLTQLFPFVSYVTLRNDDDLRIVGKRNTTELFDATHE